ncbi:MAG: exonuclease SbcCD subunit D [Chloroflexia bacterium]
MPALRILHLADIHLGVENYGRIDPATGLSTRLLDFIKSLNAAIDWALENDIHLVVIAGDIFKNRDPTPTVQREFARLIRRLSEAGMPTFIVVGNHDVPNTWKRANSVEIYSVLAVPQVTIAHQPGLHVIDTRVGKVQVVALPWLSRSFVLSSSDNRNLSPDELNRKTLELIEEFIDRQVEELDPTLPSILVAHASVQGAVFSSERDIMLGQDVVIPKSIIANPRFDYVAMGHIHKFQVLSYGRPPIVYPGSLERIDFGEEKDKKGFVLVEIGEPGEDGAREVTHTFQEVAARPFLTIKVNADRESPTEEVLRRIEERAEDAREAVVRLVIETSAEHERDLRHDEIRRALTATGAVYSSVTTQVARHHRSVLGDQGIEQMTPEQALQLYLQNKGATPERTQLLINYYRQLDNAASEE